MFRARVLLALAVVVYVASMAAADAPLVYAVGFVSGGPGPTGYAYEVDAASYPMMEFLVGTNDLDIDHYSGVLVPEGWHFAVEPNSLVVHSCGLFTPVGHLGGGQCWGVPAGIARWWTEDPAHAIEHFVFGYDHPWRAEDLGWRLFCERPEEPTQYEFFENWGAEVGAGEGPLHGPYEEPVLCWEAEMCEEYQYCYFADCGLESGVCVGRPWLCREIYAPVCGCDGLTYGNACAAASSGMSIAYNGPCLPGDLDVDGDVDVRDYVMFESCLLGPDHEIPPRCESADLDFDIDVDLADWRVFQITMATRAPYLESYSHDGCLRDAGEGPCPEDDAFELRVEDGTLHIIHHNATYNCCLDEVEVTFEANMYLHLLRFIETEIVPNPCYCICCYRVESTVVDLAPGPYDVQYCWYDYMSAEERCYVDTVVIP